MNRTLFVFVTFALNGCIAAHEVTPTPELELSECGVPFVAQCSPDSGAMMVQSDDGPTAAVSTCGMLRRIEEAFYARGAELGCGCEPFPLEANPLGTFDGCFAWQADQHAAFLRSSGSCDVLIARAALPTNYAGFECGGSRCFAPPYFPDREHGAACGVCAVSGLTKYGC